MAPCTNVIMVGEGRTTGKESISPSHMPDSGMFVSKDDVTEQIPMPDGVEMGEGEGFDRRNFTPGLPLIPYSVVFKYDDRYQPGPTIRLSSGMWSMARGTWPATKKPGKTAPLVTSFTFRSGCCRPRTSGNQTVSKARCASSSNKGW